MEDVFESGNIEPLKAMHAAAHGDKRFHHKERSGTAAPLAEEAEVEVEAMRGNAEDRSNTGGERKGGEGRTSEDEMMRGARPPSTTPTTISTSSVDWEAVKAAAVAAPRYNSHVKASKWKSPPVTWAMLHAYQQREAASGDFAAAVAVETVLSIGQQLCIRYGYASASCNP